MWTKKASSRFNPSRSPNPGDGDAESQPGTVTGIEPQRRRRSERRNVHLDGKFAFSLTADAASRLHAGEDLDAERIRELLDRDAVDQAYQRAVRFLAARPRSVAEVRGRLRRAGIDDGATAQAVERLEHEGLIDDQQFAAYWVGQRQTFRPRGPRALRFELLSKGVSDQAMAPAVATAAGEQNEAACRAALAEARRRRSASEADFTRSLTSYLTRRGFDFSVTRAAVRELWKAVAHESRGA